MLPFKDKYDIAEAYKRIFALGGKFRVGCDQSTCEYIFKNKKKEKVDCFLEN